MRIPEVTLDLNCGVSFLMTERGKEILKEYFDENPPSESEEKRYLSSYYIEDMPFWKFMNIFGPHLYKYQKDIPFSRNEVTIREHEDER